MRRPGEACDPTGAPVPISTTVTRVTIVETLLVYAVIPVGSLALLAVVTMARRPHRPVRYKPGQSWDHPPVWWTANPAGLPDAGDGAPALRAGTDVVGGGARGTW